MHLEDERSLCQRCGHDELKHYSNDPGLVYAECRGLYHDGPGLSDVVACKCHGFRPL